MTYVDAVVLQLACPRPIRFIVHESIYQIGWLTPIFKLVEAIPISNVRAKEALREAADRIRKGEIVCIFPEGELSRTGTLIKLRKGFELIARLAECDVVPVWLDGLWGSIFSFEGGRYFLKFPKRIPQVATIAFGSPIPARSVDYRARPAEASRAWRVLLSETAGAYGPPWAGDSARSEAETLRRSDYRRHGWPCGEARGSACRIHCAQPMDQETVRRANAWLSCCRRAQELSSRTSR